MSHDPVGDEPTLHGTWPPKHPGEHEEFREAFERVGFGYSDADILAGLWPLDHPPGAAETAAHFRDLGCSPVRIVEWHRIGIELRCTHLIEVWVKYGWTPTDVVCLAWACERTTGWHSVSMGGWAACVILDGLTPQRAVGYASAWYYPDEAGRLESSKAPPTDETLRFMAAMRSDRPFPGSC